MELDTLDNMVAVNGIEKVKLLKIDVEGWESEVLSGATALLRSECIPIIILEYPGNRGTAQKIYNFIVNINDYEIYSFKGSKNIVSPLKKIRSGRVLPRGDNIVCIPPSQWRDLPRELFV